VTSISNMPIADEMDKALSELWEPAVILNPSACSLLGANAAGQRLWGVDFAEPSTPTRLDVAMPAISYLRALEAVADGNTLDNERVTFWTPRGVLDRPCRIRPLLRAGRSSVFIVSWPAAVADVRERKSAHGPKPVVHPFNADAETLRKIAQRIREKPEAGSVVSAQWPSDAGHLATAVSSTAEDQSDREPDALSKLAHELRTPLAAIIALAEIMTEQHLGALPNERYRGYMRDIRDSARHALGLVDGLFARNDLEKDHDELFFSAADLNDVAGSCVSALQPLADKAGVVLSSALTATLPHVVADIRCLKQILLNLLSNSIKYAGHGALVTVTTGFELAGRTWVEVHDTGPGIAPDVIARVLRTGPISGARQKQRGRKGLGLPLSRRLAEINGARLEITNPNGAGACVRVVFARDRVMPV
jgi:two-component system, cell cycle sensor histidine kinase PleC